MKFNYWSSNVHHTCKCIWDYFNGQSCTWTYNAPTHVCSWYKPVAVVPICDVCTLMFISSLSSPFICSMHISTLPMSSLTLSGYNIWKLTTVEWEIKVFYYQGFTYIILKTMYAIQLQSYPKNMLIRLLSNFDMWRNYVMQCKTWYTEARHPQLYRSVASGISQM